MRFDEAIQEIKQRVDLSQVIGRYVKLRRAGRNWLGLCPFHQERTPSFNVRPDLGYYKCFGCGESGDVFSFLERQTGQLFADVVKELAKETGIEIEFSARHEESAEKRNEEDRQRRALEAAQTYFVQALKNSPHAMQYLVRERGLGPNVIQKWGIGFAGQDDGLLIDHLREQNLLQEAIEAGLVREGQYGLYCFFSRRITIPIFDAQKKLIGFGGRAFGPDSEGKPKYINSAQSILYDKASVLFGLPEALPMVKQGAQLAIVEGYFDVMACQHIGLAAVAPCGTSLTDHHVERLAKYAKEITLCFDQDSAGKKATKRGILALLQAGVLPKCAILKGKDPDDLMRHGKVDQLKQAFSQASDGLQHLLVAANEESVHGVARRIGAIRELLPFLAAIKDPLVVRQYVRMAARILSEDEGLLMRQVQKLAPHLRNLPLPERTEKKQTQQPPSEQDQLLMQAILRNPQLISHLEPWMLDGRHSVFKNWFGHSPSLPKALLDDGRWLSALVRTAKLLSEQDAERIVLDFAKSQRQGLEKEDLKRNLNELIEAQQKGDLTEVRNALKKHSSRLKQWRGFE